MKIGILGSGPVAQRVGSALKQKGYEVMLGGRSLQSDGVMAWLQSGGLAGTFAEAARFGDLVLNFVNGNFSTQAVQQAGIENLAGKILLDGSNPLDFSRGLPPSITSAPGTSVGDDLQQMLPNTRVVKALNTISIDLMTEPQTLGDGIFDVYICGDDEAAKLQVQQWLTDAFGYLPNSFVDLGGISNSRVTEAIVPFALALCIRKGVFRMGIRHVT
jgi:8-hydroxy-5-deazaflavin:NADPH oxidoreductase